MSSEVNKKHLTTYSSLHYLSFRRIIFTAVAFSMVQNACLTKWPKRPQKQSELLPKRKTTQMQKRSERPLVKMSPKGAESTNTKTFRKYTC